MASPTRILVIGGGIGGTDLAQRLGAHPGLFEVTLVDRKTYFEVTFAALRGLVEPDTIGKAMRKPYADFGRFTFVQGEVAALDDHSARLVDGRSLEFDFAVIASGSSYASFPAAKTADALDVTAREAELRAEFARLEAAGSVLIVGGGAVGVELAGEIAYRFPGKPVRLVHGGARLLDALAPKTGKIALEKLGALGVTVELGVLLDPVEGAPTRFRARADGRIVEADLVYRTVGVAPNIALLKPHLADALNPSGFVAVNERLQVRGHPTLYAIGDVSDLPDAKMGANAGRHAALVADNLIAAAKPGGKLKAFKPGPVGAIMPIGKVTGVAQIGSWTNTLKPMIGMKQKDVFITFAMKRVGAI